MTKKKTVQTLHGNVSPPASARQDLLQLAVDDLQINVPIYRVEFEGETTIVLYLYGRAGPVRWTWPGEAKKAAT